MGNAHQDWQLSHVQHAHDHCYGISSQQVPYTSPSPTCAERRPARICIDGNIGSGKSTVINRLMTLPDQEDPSWLHWRIIEEPVADKENLLEIYYAEHNLSAKQAYATLLQQAVLNSYALRVPHPSFAPYVITERSPWSSLAVFLPTQQLPADLMALVYQSAHHMYHNIDNALPTALVYLRSTPEVSLKRITQRQRPGEHRSTLDYLQRLHDKYEEQVRAFPGPISIVDATQDSDTVYAAITSAVEALHAQHGMEPPALPAPDTPVQCPTAPFVVQRFVTLELLFPGKLLSTCDPYVLRLFPESAFDA